MAASTVNSLGLNQGEVTSSKAQAEVAIILGKTFLREGASVSLLAGMVQWLYKEESIYGVGINQLDIGFRTISAFSELKEGAELKITRNYNTRIAHSTISNEVLLTSEMWLTDLQFTHLFPDQSNYTPFLAKLLFRLVESYNVFGYVLMLKLFAPKESMSGLSKAYKEYEKCLDTDIFKNGESLCTFVKDWNDKFKNISKIKTKITYPGTATDSEKRERDLIYFSQVIRRKIDKLCSPMPDVENTWTWPTQDGNSADAFASNATRENLIAIMSFEDYQDMKNFALINLGYVETQSRYIVSPENWGIGKIIALPGVKSGNITIIHRDCLSILPRFDKMEDQRWAVKASTQYLIHKWFRIGHNPNLPGIKIEYEAITDPSKTWYLPASNE